MFVFETSLFILDLLELSYFVVFLFRSFALCVLATEGTQTSPIGHPSLYDMHVCWEGIL